MCAEVASARALCELGWRSGWACAWRVRNSFFSREGLMGKGPEGGGPWGRVRGKRL